jgi:Flp pilus assembly protein TadG
MSNFFRHSDGERGAVAIIVGLSLLVLMGFTALALDAGLGYSERRGTQNAADLSALAAAWEDCNPVTSGTPNPIQAARATALDNGYDHSLANTDVTVNDLGDGQWQVDILTTNEATFGAATPYANDSVTVLSSAIAECEAIPFLGGYALFAGGPTSCNGGVELDLSGASKIINGGIHSNGEVKITGASTDVNGQVTHVGGSTWPGSIQVYEHLPYPIDITIADYRPTGARALVHNDVDPLLDRYYDFDTTDIDATLLVNQGYADNISGSEIRMKKSGVYYTKGDIKITKNISMGTDALGNPVKVTWVAEGQIEISAKTNMSGFDPVIGGPSDPGVLFFSNYPGTPPDCTANAIKLSSSGITWTGVIFAPNGQVSPSFSTATSLNGSIFAYTINVSGSDFEISWQNNPTAIPDFRVNLLK